MDGGANESMLKSFFKSKWILFILLIDIIVIIVIITLLIINSNKSSKLVFSVTPLDATISVNGNTGFTNGSNSISPGKYDITISRDGLESKNFTADIVGDQTVTISAFLADADKTFDFYKLTENVSSMEKLQEIASKSNNLTTDHDTSAEEFILEYETNASNANLVLPFNYTEYKDSSDSPTGKEVVKDITIRKGSPKDCKQSLCIEVLMALTDDRELVKQLLEERGINPNGYEIIYKTY
ncbi:PEGA domain-containing protein [Candidatus Saccharibacteria bacterium]|nr:PEGA domain-containing protein [Candidatus Saccharibacteria bacterium]